MNPTDLRYKTQPDYSPTFQRLSDMNKGFEMYHRMVENTIREDIFSAIDEVWKNIGLYRNDLTAEDFKQQIILHMKKAR